MQGTNRAYFLFSPTPIKNFDYIVYFHFIHTIDNFLQRQLGKWRFKSKTYDTFYDGYMFPLLVQEELDSWPEKAFRQRKWVGEKCIAIQCKDLSLKETFQLPTSLLYIFFFPYV